MDFIKSTNWESSTETQFRLKFPMHRACRDGDIDELSVLLNNAQHGIYEEDAFYGWTAAHWASFFGKLHCLRKLLETTAVGVNPDIRSSKFAQTPLHLAAFGGHSESLRWLVEYQADCDLKDYLGETPVHKAARSGSMECVSLLTAQGAQLGIRNSSGDKASDVAAACGHPPVSNYILRAEQLSAHNASPAHNDTSCNGTSEHVSNGDVDMDTVGPSDQNAQPPVAMTNGSHTGIMDDGSCIKLPLSGRKRVGQENHTAAWNASPIDVKRFRLTNDSYCSIQPTLAAPAATFGGSTTAILSEIQLRAPASHAHPSSASMHPHVQHDALPPGTAYNMHDACSSAQQELQYPSPSSVRYDMPVMWNRHRDKQAVPYNTSWNVMN